MKIVICGSMAFAKEMLQTKTALESRGHKVTVPENTQMFVEGSATEENKWLKMEFDVFKEYFKKIKGADSVLVLNITKNNVENYLGANALIEMAFARVLDKKIYLLNPIPKTLSYTDEIEAMNPIVLNGDWIKIH